MFFRDKYQHDHSIGFEFELQTSQRQKGHNKKQFKIMKKKKRKKLVVDLIHFEIEISLFVPENHTRLTVAIPFTFFWGEKTDHRLRC